MFWQLWALVQWSIIKSLVTSGINMWPQDMGHIPPRRTMSPSCPKILTWEYSLSVAKNSLRWESGKTFKKSVMALICVKFWVCLRSTCLSVELSKKDVLGIFWIFVYASTPFLPYWTAWKKVSDAKKRKKNRVNYHTETIK